MRLVIALGGNALASSGRPEGADRQRERIADAASAIADIARVHEVVITHGNGPQIGFLAAQNRFASELPILPLDVLGAETEGMIGYWLESALASIFPGSELATLLTQVEVAADDPAFDRPSKPIGPCVSAAEAEVLTKRFGFVMAPVDGGLRRIVPSPRPLRIREDKTIELLVDAGVLVICAGGGGIPVVVTPGGGLHGVEAVIDKDLTAAVLAEKIRCVGGNRVRAGLDGAEGRGCGCVREGNRETGVYRCARGGEAGSRGRGGHVGFDRGARARGSARRGKAGDQIETMAV